MKATMRVSGLAMALAMAAACNGGSPAMDAASDGSDIVTSDATDASDATADTATDANDVATDVPVDASDAGTCTLSRVLVSTSDYMNFGGFVVADLATRTFHSIPATDAGAGVDQDHANRTSGCIPFDLEHSSPGAIAQLDATHILPPARTLTLTAIPGPDGGVTSENPYDIAVINPHKAYVSQYNNDHLAIVDPTANTVTGSIDLHVLADSDGIPEMASITVAGNRAYVALQQLDRANLYAVPAHSHIAVIDTTTDTLVDVDPATAGTQAITLTCSNPVALMPVDATGQFMLVAEPGDLYTDGDGCLDVIDLSNDTIAHTLTNAMLAGDPSSVDIVVDPRAWVTVDGPTPEAGAATHSIREFNLRSGTLTPTAIASSTMYQYTNLRRAPDGTVWAIGGDYNAGSIHAFSSTGAPLGTPYTTGMLNTLSIDFVP